MNSVKKNYIYNVIYEILVIIIPLITSPYISRVLGAENIGIYTYHYTIVSYFLLFARLGILNYGTREIAGAHNDDEKNHIFSNTLAVQCILAALTTALYLLYVFASGEKDKSLPIIMTVYLLSSVFDISWFFFGVEQFKVTVTRNIVLKIISTVLIFAFVKTGEDLWVYTVILAACNLIGQMVVWPYLKGSICFCKPRYQDLIKVIVPVMILFVPQIAVSLYKMMDKIMVGAMCNKAELAYYEYASMIVGLPLGFITSLGNVMMPHTTALLKTGEKGKNEQYIHYSMLFSVGLSIAFAFGISAVAPVFIPLYFGDEFLPTVPILTGLSSTIVFISWANVVRTQCLIPQKRDKEYIVSLFCGAGINIVINILLIPRYKAWGAVIGTIAAEAMVCIVQTVMARDSIPVLVFLKENTPFLAIGGLMFFVVRGVQYLELNHIAVVVIQVLTGIAIYVPLALWYSSKFLHVNIRKIF